MAQLGLLKSVAVLPFPDESAEVVPLPSSKRHRPSSPVLSEAPTSCAQVVPQAPQLPASVVVVSQVMGTTTPTTSRPFAPAPIVCEKVNPLAPVAGGARIDGDPARPGGAPRCEEAGRGDRQRVEDDERGEPFPPAHAGDEAERQHQLQQRAARIARGDRTPARRGRFRRCLAASARPAAAGGSADRRSRARRRWLPGRRPAAG